jgi:glutathione peroxidase-family protein
MFLLCRPVVGKFSHPYFKYLTTNLANPNNVTRITLNYEKFLVDAEGKVLRR